MQNKNKIFFRMLVFNHFKNDKKVNEIYNEFVRLYPHKHPSISFVWYWMRRFRLGYTSFNDEPRSGRPKNTIDGKYDSKLKEMIAESPTISIRALAHVMHSSMTKTRVYINKNLGLKKVSCKWMPFKLTEKHKQARIDFCHNFLNTYGNINKKVLYNLVTGDETWLRFYDPLIGPQSKIWAGKDMAPQKITKKSMADKKIMVCVFFSKKAVETVTLLNKEEKANAHWFRDQCIVPLIDKWQNSHVKHSSNNLVIHFDNAPPHTSNIVNNYINDKKRVSRLDHPPYSPDLSPCDFWLFPTIKNKMKGSVYLSESEILEDFQKNLDLLGPNNFNKAYIEWIKRCKEVIRKNGDYY